MRKVSNYANKRLHDEQYRVFVDLISKIRNKNELSILLDALLTKSEKVYISQRLNVMRMLAKSFSYDEIQDHINVPKNTISKTNLILQDNGLSLKQVLLKYRFRFPKADEYERKTTGRKIDPNKAHYPGAIKL